ncbi:MAG: hypothetical protein LC772_12355, partial [Chloroflexi bacterium]|nr:hypothetical protein [Chloroflexota bacterium]
GVATAVIALPGSGPMNRLEAVWRPSLRDARRGEADLARWDTTGARKWFSKAMQQRHDAASEIQLLDFINEACRRNQAWTLSSEYSRLLLQKRDSLLDQVRYGEAMFECGDVDQAQTLYQSVTGLRLKPDAPASDRLAQVLAERDEASILEYRATDLSRASSLVDAAIKAALKDGDSVEILASLNDTMSTIHFRMAQTLHQKPDLQVARVYSETAVDELPGVGNQAVVATVLFHLSRVYAEEGATSASTKAYNAARKASQPTVDRLRGPGGCNSAGLIL